MNKIQLKYAVIYSQKRGNSEELLLGNYISTDNLLQNKLGVTIWEQTKKVMEKYRDKIVAMK